jgi:hypothetical protein
LVVEPPGKTGLVEVLSATTAHECGLVVWLLHCTFTFHPWGTFTVICPFEYPSKLKPVMFSIRLTVLVVESTVMYWLFEDDGAAEPASGACGVGWLVGEGVVELADEHATTSRTETSAVARGGSGNPLD